MTLRNRPEKGRRYLLLGAVYCALAVVDFVGFLYSGHLSRGLTACLVLLLAVGWERWFHHMLKPDVTKLDINVPNKMNNAKQ